MKFQIVFTIDIDLEEQKKRGEFVHPILETEDGIKQMGEQLFQHHFNESKETAEAVSMSITDKESGKVLFTSSAVYERLSSKPVEEIV